MRLGHVVEVEAQQRLLRRGRQAVVDGEVPQVEEEIAHAAVLVVDDPHVVAVEQEVRVQQVVVARTIGERMLGQRGLDVSGLRVDLIERRRRGDPALGRDRAIVLHDPEHGERRRDRRAGVDRPHRPHDGAEHVLALQVLLRDVGALHEPRDQRAEVGEEREDLGSDAGGGCGGRRLVLGGAIDPQQVGVLAREPDHERPAADVHLEVAVRDADRDRRDVGLVALPLRDGRDHRGERRIQRLVHAADASRDVRSWSSVRGTDRRRR